MQRSFIVALSKFSVGASVRVFARHDVESLVELRRGGVEIGFDEAVVYFGCVCWLRFVSVNILGLWNERAYREFAPVELEFHLKSPYRKIAVWILREVSCVDGPMRRKLVSEG